VTPSHPLSDRTLHRHTARVAVPSYDRRALRPAVVHVSVGYFHRSHQAVYLDDLARAGVTGWGLVGVGLRRRRMRDALVPQDCLYTVVERGAGGDRARIVGVMGRYLFAPDDGRAVVDALAAESTRLVTLTVTGAAYRADAPAPDPDDEEVNADLADPSAPRSALAILVEALDARRRAGRGPLTILSCDNLPASGDVARTAVVAFARQRDERLARWIEEGVAFPSSMVDRITPKTTDADRERLAREFGVADRWPVMTEPFSEWVVEDAFCGARPPLDEVGVRFVADVRPYALLKTRLLNGTHCALGHLGFLAGLRRADEAMADPVLAAYVDRLMAEEVAPPLPRIAGFDVRDYRHSVVARLANPKIGDQLERLCRGGSLKLPRHVVPAIEAARGDGLPHPLLTLAVAGWVRHARGVDDAGRPYAIDDPVAPRLRALAGDPRGLLTLLGPLAADAGFVAEVEDVLRDFDRRGVHATVAAAVGPTERLAA
jgi:mannitol 2-dehydrogenase